MSKRNLFLLITIIGLSLLSGVVGGLVVRSYLLNLSFDVPLFGDINLGSSYRRGNLIISQPRKVVVQQDDRLAGVVAEAQKSVVEFNHKKNNPALAHFNQPALNAAPFYFNYERVGRGLVLTNDGWALTGAKIIQPENFIAVDYEGNIMPLESTAENKAGGYFVKVRGQNLAAVQFADKGDAAVGQLLAVLHDDEVRVAYVKNILKTANAGAVQSSEGWYRRIKISPSSLTRGDIVFNLSGLALGLYAADDLVMPIGYYVQPLANLLNKTERRPTFLGVNYLSLSALVSEQELAGALLAPDAKGVAVVKNSPAAQAGLKAGDIILEIDGVIVDADNDLSELIQSDQPGKEIEVTSLRGKNKEKIKVKLGGG